MAWWPNIYRIRGYFCQEKIFANTRFWRKVNLFCDFFRSVKISTFWTFPHKEILHVLITQSAVVPYAVDYASLKRPWMRVCERRTSVCLWMPRKLKASNLCDLRFVFSDCVANKFYARSTLTRTHSRAFKVKRYHASSNALFLVQVGQPSLLAELSISDDTRDLPGGLN